MGDDGDDWTTATPPKHLEMFRRTPFTLGVLLNISRCLGGVGVVGRGGFEGVD